MTIIDKNSRIPLYCQLTDEIIRQIQSGILKQNEKLPSEREMCEMYSLSRTTVRQTMMELKKEGYIQIKHGKGSFVSPLSILHDIRGFYSFTDEIKNLGKKPTSKILQFEIVDITDELKKVMDLYTCKRLYKITRLRLADDQPLMHEITYLPVDRFPGLTLQMIEDRSLYETLEESYHLQITGGKESLKATAISKDIAKFLVLKPGTPSIFVVRKTHEHGRIIEYTETVTRGDQFVFRINLSK